MTRVSRKRILLTLIAVLSASLPAAAASTAAQAAPATGQPPAIPVFSGSLGGVSATSPADAWAVGDQCPTCNNSTTLILHWNGTAWTRVHSPDPGNINSVGAVAAATPSSAWTVGFTCVTSVCGVNANALILHWNGTAWTRSSG